jgi:S-DNA-T family DNA segregation ATPase FtsK/SpoIIIE
MRSGAAALSFSGPGQGIAGFLRRQVGRLVGASLLAAMAFALASLGTWNVADPSFSNATDNPVTNAMGFPGAAFSDLVMQFYGLAAVPALAPAVVWGLLLVAGQRVDRKPRRIVAWFGATLLVAAAAGCITPPETWPLPSGLGGVFGDIVLKLPALALGAYPSGGLAMGLAVAFALPALALAAFGSGLILRRPVEDKPARTAAPASDADEEEDDEDDEGGLLAIGALTHWWLSARAFVRRRVGGRRDHADDGLGDPLPQAGGWRAAAERVEVAERAEIRVTPGRARVEPEFFAALVAEKPATPTPVSHDDEPPFDIDDDRGAGHAFEAEDFDDDEPVFAEPRPVPRVAAPQRAVARAPEPATPSFQPAPLPPQPMQPRNGHVQAFRSPAGRVQAPAPPPSPSPRVEREAQTLMFRDEAFEMPSLHFLSEPKSVTRDPSLSKDALEQNARTLEGVLEDFGVKGEIVNVRPGPVVTLYELEPAPGIKSSRVIGLADDIARSMSAIACRVAVVPGRNAIGIELPNQRRETVYLREMLASRDFNESACRLALALGKTINGEPVVVDIAKMPHVLVAGTTGSGKSVAINTMVLSLLYKLTPDKCRLIMIDPKMVELSVYDGIPHLLTPVVTDPKKAVVALKWTVREMEDRYRKMAKVGVRNIDGFNARVAQAQKKGEQISRTVQTGFDRETGEAVYETESFDLEPFPFIVVIIDEVADLMMVAGKDIEGAVQRLGQMARAAGIHVIMATQRPSVDVITGTIKANFPTRMSFQVTSKIDSRTILGEQGAEQLLGMGDMLYMAGGGRIQRVHGPFVSDDEVEKVVAHLKLQGAPEYLDAITQDDEDGDEDDGPRAGSGGGSGNSNLDDSDDPYDQAVAVVLRDGKASTSYIQRRLGIGYNRAASIIERMEKEGIVGAANHAGKREILVPTEDDKM